MLRKLFLYCYAFCRVFENVQYYLSRGRRKPECICKKESPDRKLSSQTARKDGQKGATDEDNGKHQDHRCGCRVR